MGGDNFLVKNKILLILIMIHTLTMRVRALLTYWPVLFPALFSYRSSLLTKIFCLDILIKNLNSLSRADN